MAKSGKLSRFVKDPRKAFSFTRYKLNKVSGKIIFQNDVGLEGNLNAKRTLGIINQADPKSTIQESDDGFIVEFKKKGYAKLGCPYDDNLINSIREKYNKMIEDDRYSVIRRQYKNQVFNRMIFRAFKLIPEVKQLLNDKIINMLEKYHGNFQVHYVQMKRNYHVPAAFASQSEMYANYWHNDDQRDWYDNDGKMISVSKLFINLVNITEQNGPFHIQSKEKSKKLLEMGFKSRFNYNLPKEDLEDPNDMVKGVGPPGSTMWATTRYCLHRAEIPALGQHRDLIILQIKSSDEPLKDDWPNHCVDLSGEKTAMS